MIECDGSSRNAAEGSSHGRHGPVGDSASGLDYEESEHSGRVVRIASVAALGGLLFGYDSAVINGAVAAVEDHFQISKFVTGVAVAAALIGAALGAVVAGRLADKIGRLSVMKIAALLFLISAFGTGLAPNVWIFGLFRVVGGIGVGVASVIAPAYIAETSPPRIRGRLGSLQQLAIVTGIFVSLAVDALLAHLAGGSREELWLGLQAWRWMFIIMAVPAVLYGALAFTIPESPRYLVATYRIPEARKVLSMLLGEKNLELTITRIQESLKSEKPPSWSDLRKPTGGLYGIVWVGVGLLGVPAVRRHQRDLLLLQCAVAGRGIRREPVVHHHRDHLGDEHRTTLIAIALIDKIGRKPLLLIGSTGMAVTLGTMAVIFGTAPVVDGQPHLAGAAGRSHWSPPTCSWWRSACRGVRWCGCCSARCSRTASGPPRSAWPPRPVDCQLPDHGVASRSWASSRCPSPTASMPSARCCRSLFVWRWVDETKGKHLEDMHGEAHHAPTPH